MPDLEIQESKTSSEEGIISKYKVTFIVGGVVVTAAVSVVVAYSTGFIGSPAKTPEKTPEIKPPDEINPGIPWTAFESCKYSALTADLKDFASKNKAKAPASMQDYLENMELYDFALTLNNAKVIEDGSGSDCEKISRVKKVMNQPCFDISLGKKKTVKSLVKACKDKGLLPTNDEDRYEPIKDFLNENAHPSYMELMEDEDANENFEALGKLTEEERGSILGDAVNGLNQLLLKKSLLEIKRIPKGSPERKVRFEKNSELYVQCLNSPDLELVYLAITLLHKLILLKDSTVTREVLDLKILPRILSFLSEEFNASSELELSIVFVATNILLSITARTHKETEFLVNAGAIPLLVANSIWALGNIALDCIEYRDLILDSNILEILLKAVRISPFSTIELDFVRRALWTLMNLTRSFEGKYPIWTKISGAIPILEILLKSSDEETVKKVANVLNRLVNNPDMVVSEMACLLERIGEVVNSTSNSEIKRLLTFVASKISTN